jgi:hypothetical protein
MCQLDHVRNQTVLVSPTSRHSSLCGSVLAQDAANATLGNLQLATHKIGKRCRHPTPVQLYGVKFQGSSSSILLAG